MEMQQVRHQRNRPELMDERVRVGILGCGHVGGALVRLIHDHADVIEARAGVPLEVARVAVHDLTKERDLPLPTRCFTDDAAAVVDDPDVDIVVEVIGGIEPARRLIVEALMGGKPVVTANKELVATHGRELFETAEGAGVDILFEASVGGGIPLIRPLRESLAGDRIRRVMGIVNGTTNYILTGMTDAGASFADALAEAQRARVRRNRPDRRRRGVRRRGQGGDHRLDRVRRARGRGRRVPRGHHRDHARRHRVGARPRLRREAARDRGGVRRRDRGARPPGDGARCATRWPRCATRSTRSSSRATRSASSCSTAGVRAACPPRRRCSATWSTRRRTWSRGARAPPWARSPRSRSAPSPTSSRSSTCRWRWPTVPGVLHAIAEQFEKFGGVGPLHAAARQR